MEICGSESVIWKFSETEEERKKNETRGGGLRGGGEEKEKRRRRYKGQQRGANTLQFKMFHLLIRTSALTLLVTMVTAEQGITCRQEIPAELIRDLWGRTRQLIDKLPVRSITC